jgi:hypothetical protein
VAHCGHWLDGAERAAAVDQRLAALAREAEEADDRLRRLYKLVEDGRDDANHIPKARIVDLRLTREKTLAALDRAKSGTRGARILLRATSPSVRPIWGCS